MEEFYWQASTIARESLNALLRLTTGFNQTLVSAVLNQLNGLDAQVSGLTPLPLDAAGSERSGEQERDTAQVKHGS
jgi:hypothetical protein